MRPYKYTLMLLKVKAQLMRKKVHKHYDIKYIFASTSICLKIDERLLSLKSTNRDNFSNNDGKIRCLLVWLTVWLFDIQSKIFLYMDNPWILLFQMICERAFIKLIFKEKLAVCDQWVLRSLSDFGSLTLTPSYFFPNNDGELFLTLITMASSFSILINLFIIVSVFGVVIGVKNSSPSLLGKK